MSSLLTQRATSHTDESVNARIEELLQFMDPDADTIQDRNVVECLVWGGFWVAASDGQIANVEVDALRKFGDSRQAGEAALAIQRSTEPLNLIRNRFHRSAEACRNLLPYQRHAMIQQLIAVAKAHFPVDAKEMNTLRSICMALNVNPSFPEKILWQYEDFVFAQY